jgi:hypothetical protein
VKPCESPDWFEWVQLALVRMALEQLTPEEERALWLYAEGATLAPKQRTLAETALQKIRRTLGVNAP